jgi:hypothetical protein
MRGFIVLCVSAVSVCFVSVHHRDTARPGPQPIELLKESFNQPAKLADIVIAPGEGSRAWGNEKPKCSEPTKWATEETLKVVPDQSGSTDLTDYSSVVRFAGSVRFGCHPRLGCLAWGYHSLHPLRGLIGLKGSLS